MLQKKIANLNQAKKEAKEKEVHLAQKFRKLHPRVSTLKKEVEVDVKLEREKLKMRMMQQIHRRKPGEENLPVDSEFLNSRYHHDYILVEGTEQRPESAITSAVKLARIAELLMQKRREIKEKQEEEKERRFGKAIKKVFLNKDHEDMLKRLENISLQDRKRRQENIQATSVFGQPQRQKKLNDIFSKTFLFGKIAFCNCSIYFNESLQSILSRNSLSNQGNSSKMSSTTPLEHLL